MPVAVTFRPATAEDEPFLRRVYVSTRLEELSVTPWSEEQKLAFLADQFRLQSAYYAQNYPAGEATTYRVILCDGIAAGRLIVNSEPKLMRIVDIALLPEYRGQGIGGSILGDLLAEADARGAMVSIHVEKNNPAMRLYARLGFVPVKDVGVYLLLERKLNRDAAATSSTQ